MFLKFPPLLGGNGGWPTYVVLLAIVAAVVAVFVVVYRLLREETVE